MSRLDVCVTTVAIAAAPNPFRITSSRPSVCPATGPKTVRRREQSVPLGVIPIPQHYNRLGYNLIYWIGITVYAPIRFRIIIK